jgi:ATP-dependent helicase/DNAse subunit B
MKIYARERQKVGTGVKQPRFRVVAVIEEQGESKHLKVESTHFRKVELEHIAKDIEQRSSTSKRCPKKSEVR